MGRQEAASGLDDLPVEVWVKTRPTYFSVSEKFSPGFHGWFDIPELGDLPAGGRPGMELSDLAGPSLHHGGYHPLDQPLVHHAVLGKALHLHGILDHFSGPSRTKLALVEPDLDHPRLPPSPASG